ncbi:hypothetical protein ARMGADRAFT_1072586 [Armillaria gallica]|uniref:Uncharacterized protein n=1 Tax=Armillaria gallica TaxID=47427 RepID=A0A2H3DYD5_ARMGA|nr:hypothetical protein ARMGADRAFT_1072586 [Armillaria gallica]
MKISASSSLIFATLAISSSSTSLAAPAGETSQATGMSTSSSNHHVASRRGSFNMARSDAEGATTVVQKRQVVNKVLCSVESALPVVGSLLGPLLNFSCGPAEDAASEASVESNSSASGAGDSGDDSNPDPNPPSLPSQSPPPPPPNTPLTGATDAAPVSPSSPPSPPSPPPASQRRDVPGSIRGRSLPPRDGSADGDQKPLNATPPTPPSTTTDTPKAVVGSAESHSSPVAPTAEAAEVPVQNSPVSSPVSPPGSLPAGPASGPAVQPPVDPDHAPGEVKDKAPAGTPTPPVNSGQASDAVKGNLSNASKGASPAPPKRDSATPEW